MKIGLDMSVLQTPHRKRGIGAVAINFFNNLSDKHKKNNTFVLFLEEENRDEALKILDLTNVDYEVATIDKISSRKLPIINKVNRLASITNSALDVFKSRNGVDTIKDSKNIEAYIQFDQMKPLPKGKFKKTVILYDLIPYIMEADYLWSYKTARNNGDSKKASIRKALLRKKYITQAKHNCKNADKLIAISKHTKKDFIKYTKTSPGKINVVYLGADNHKTSDKIIDNPNFLSYQHTAWGDIRNKPVDLAEKPFLMYIGGADPRRKINDVVATFNNLKARGHDIRLVLAGDTMMGQNSIPIHEIKDYLSICPYLDDVVFLGFVTDQEKAWLYKNALAVIYPSKYEGFGLPILEAMQYGTTVISYKNTSVTEIAGDTIFYCQDSLDMYKKIDTLVQKRNKKTPLNIKSVEKAKVFNWKSTAEQILKITI